MFIIQKEIGFDAGHRVPLHESKCKNPHGHRYRVVAHVQGELITSGPESGMVRDFSIVKELLTTLVHDVYDHGFIVAKADTGMRMALGTLNEDGTEVSFLDSSRFGWKVIEVPFYPTAECLAKKIYGDLKENGLPGLIQIDVWETPTSCASYTDDEVQYIISDFNSTEGRW